MPSIPDFLDIEADVSLGDGSTTSYSRYSIVDDAGLPMDLSTGHTVSASFSKGPGEVDVLTLSGGVANGTGITLGNGFLEVRMSPTTTRTLKDGLGAADVEKGHFSIDITRSSDGYKWRLVAGEIRVYEGA